MKYCNDTHAAVVAYSNQECPLCVANRQLIELADAREDIDQQAIQELTNDLTLLERRVRQLEARTSPSTAPQRKNIWNMGICTYCLKTARKPSIAV